MWLAYQLAFEMTGGDPEATGTIYVTVTAYDGTPQQVGQEICSQSLAFEASVSNAPGTYGDEYWDQIDGLVRWGGQEYPVENSCPWDPIDLWGVPWDEAMAWDSPFGPPFNPLTYVSCDRITSDVDLNDQHIGPDPYGMTQSTTLGEHCVDASEHMETNYGTGPMEAIWVMSVGDGVLGADYEYFLSPDGNRYWHYAGWIIEEAGNVPGPGLEGIYYGLMPWVWGA